MEKEELFKKLKEVEEKIKKIEKEKKEIEEEIKKIEIGEWKERRNEGWQPFVFYSSYYGSECGRGDTKLFYVFAPTKIDIKKWKNVEFSHGDSTESETNKNFEKELDKLRWEDYDFIDDYIVQAVWPELYEEYKKL
jgi:hypothetical protein